ncbi:hypothetical protein AXK12_05415 [Cephaloticoccus capnophilus]|uniref:Lipocalin-like domain-containing protein n=1 Tax=Cephaloticoccus capnophilus TaxID=1548208 RepID=A0A139SL49_9BACT|nr:hypothetical protein [Cephaloticoccus capnophilus]KXU35289.1 hypothetical protein AXK12_05415 [Cephaloticoccus capnophilus]
MTPRFLPLVFVLLGALPLVFAQEQEPEAGGESGEYANPVFGYYEAIRFDAQMLQGVRVNEETGDVFIMFQPDKTDTQLTLKISQAEGAQYRKWFTGEEVLVAQENAGRAINTWTDRVQTSANYIEYHAEGRIFLHLKRIRE